MIEHRRLAKPGEDSQLVSIIGGLSPKALLLRLGSGHFLEEG